jgi:hypothetical protein
LIALGGWIRQSDLLGMYFRYSSSYSRGYGSLGVALAFSIWPEAKVFYEVEPNGAGTIGKAQYVKARGEDDDVGVLLDL